MYVDIVMSNVFNLNEHFFFFPFFFFSKFRRSRSKVFISCHFASRITNSGEILLPENYPYIVV